ncbi:MAG: universal stress protein [Prevotellaceae bacterium]|jgi:nucleotide-binding universal stress UspA family protein|nr:universal stress protein [Prevotellaceae bacterium]
METKLITLAIRTSKRAENIKEVLEKNGIETVIQNINVDVPDLSVGVRIRIKESDLPSALRIVEEVEKAWEQEQKALVAKNANFILVPIDFADFVQKTIDFSFAFAHSLDAEIVFLYVYFVPPYTIATLNDRDVYSLNNGEQLRRIVSLAEADKENLVNLIQRRIEKGELPNIPFRFELKEGVADTEIVDYCKKHRPKLVVMGTHGKKISDELIGSVTAEVLESCISPIFAVPIQVPLQTPADICRMAFLTNFEQKDLIAIDSALALFKNKQLEVFFLHVSEKNERWDEILLGGIKHYFATHYPNLITHYDMLNTTHRTKALSDYLIERSIDLLAFNARRRNLFARLLNPSLAYKMAIRSDTPLFVTHI